MICKFPQTKEDQVEVMLWIAGKGPATAAVHRMIERNGITFGIALITRERSISFRNN